ncbi:cytidine deaminase-like protein, partial [Lindgomyces ingoldianus]
MIQRPDHVMNTSSAQTASSSAERLGVVPQLGRLLPLKTKDEVRAALETFDAYIVGVPEKTAGAVLNVIKNTLPDLKTADFQHLRRVAGFEFLPEHLQTIVSPAQTPETLDDDDVMLQKHLKGKVRFILICPAACIQQSDLEDALARNHPFVKAGMPPRIFTIPVPTFAPTSHEQAALWSLGYWPISYKNSNPYGPHPSIVSRNTADIEKFAGTWLALAEAAARQINNMDLGERIGCVIVSKTDTTQEIITVAGDCRWRSPTGKPMSKDGPGNVMAHAVQRAIAMVAKKRLRAAGIDSDSVCDSPMFCNLPITDLEDQFYYLNNAPPSGYLCLDLDIYTTHEPCVMCSMAILHSRFRRCVFRRRMPLTGGMTADGAKPAGDENIKGGTNGAGLGHGIFWRPSELNWKFLAWEWENADATDSDSHIEDTLQ